MTSDVLTTNRSGPLPSSADVVIVGGGIIGIALAYYLTRKGMAPLVLDRGTIGRGASSANPGTVSLITKRPGLTLSMALESMSEFNALAAELPRKFEYERLGAVLIAQTEEEWKFLDALTTAQQSAGVKTEVLGEASLRDICPFYEGPAIGASYHSADYQVNPFLLLIALAEAAALNGATLVSGVVVHGIDVGANGVSGVATSSGLVKTNCVVNAAGAWADEVAHMVGCTHRIVPIRGQLAVLRTHAVLLPAVKLTTAASLLAKHGSAATDSFALSVTPKPFSRTVLVGVSRENAGFDNRTTGGGLSQIAGLAARLTPSLAGLSVLRTWAGLRPTRVGGPLIGDGGGPHGYLAALGHGGDGVALAPVTARFLAEVISTEQPTLSIADYVGTGG